MTTDVRQLQTCHVFPMPARAIWVLLEDFGNIERWWPRDGTIRIARVVVEGAGVGMVRHIEAPGASRAISERLDFIDPATMMLKLSHAGHGAPNLPYYRATGQLIDLEGGRSVMTYRGEFRAEPGQDNAARDRLFNAYAHMFRGLESCARGERQT